MRLFFRYRFVRLRLCKYLIFILGTSFFLTPFSLFAQDNSDSLPQHPVLPNCFLSLGENGGYALLVEKFSQKLFIYDNHFNIINSFKVTTGKVRGNKKELGDKKTPEGVYFFTDVLEEKQLLPEYGVMALPMNYPNLIDLSRSKNGGGIWLHATNQPSRTLKPYDTRGCIVTHNEDILSIAGYVELEHTPVVTVDKIEYSLASKLNQEREEIMNFLQEWEDAWEKKDIDKYIAAYSQNFKFGEMDIETWKEYKTGLNEKYSFIRVNLSDIKILKYDGYVVTSCVQDYQSDQYSDLGIKRLYLMKSGEEWEITGEEWKPPFNESPKTIALSSLSLSGD